MGRLLQRITRRTRDFKDFDLRLGMNPLTGDIAVRVDEDAVRDSIRNIILTGRHEKKFYPDFGGGAFNLLFENWDPVYASAWVTNMKNEVKNYEPRAKDIVVTVYDKPDENAIEVEVQFWVQNINEPIQVSELLYRTR